MKNFRAPTYRNEPQETHPHQLKDHESIMRFMLAGNATLTLVSKRTGERFTYRIKAPKPDGAEGPVSHFVAVLTGPDNNTDYHYLGHIYHTSNEYQHGRKSKITPTAPSANAFRWFYQVCIERGNVPLDQLEIWHEGRCGRCNRKLTVPESIRSGIGPECAKHVSSFSTQGVFALHG